MKNKKVLSMVAALSLVAIVGVGGTLAYFTDTDDVSNVVTMGEVSGTLTEEGGTNDTGMTFENITPGATLQKDPLVTLDQDSQPAYVRVRVSYSEGFPANLADVQLNVDETRWSYADGYYYYLPNEGVMQPGGTEYLFTEVQIPQEWNNDVVGQEFTMDLRAEFIQAENLGEDVIERDATGNIIGWNIDSSQIEENVN